MITTEYVENVVKAKFETELATLGIQIPVVNEVVASTECIFVEANRELSARFDNINMEYTVVVDVKYKVAYNPTDRGARKDSIENMITRTMIFDDCWLFGVIPGLVENNVRDFDEKYNEQNEKYYLHKKIDLTIIGE